MSWTTNTVTVHGDSPDAELEQLYIMGDPAPESNQAFEAGKKAASALIRSGSLGTPGDTYRVFLNGHANPRHLRVGGFTNDCVSVFVGQA